MPRRPRTLQFFRNVRRLVVEYLAIILDIEERRMSPTLIAEREVLLRNHFGVWDDVSIENITPAQAASLHCAYNLTRDFLLRLGFYTGNNFLPHASLRL